MVGVGQRGPGPHAPRLLVVEDDPRLGETVEQVLAEAGYAVTRSASGVEALRLASALAPDLILLDVRLPDLSGLAVLDRLALDAQTRATPVILWTAATSHESDLWRERLTGRRVAFLPKPFRVADLLTVLTTELGRPDLADQGARRASRSGALPQMTDGPSGSRRGGERTAVLSRPAGQAGDSTAGRGVPH